MQVLVMTAIPDDERDLQIVMVARVGEVTMVSPIVTLTGEAPCRRGNPYLVYGSAVKDFLGPYVVDYSINVFDCRSGSLAGWQ